MTRSTLVQSKAGRQRARPDTVRIYTGGTGRLAHNLPISPRMFMHVSQEKQQIILTAATQKTKSAGSYRTRKSNPGAKSRLIWLLPALHELGLRVPAAAGLYRATANNSGKVIVDLASKLS